MHHFDSIICLASLSICFDLLLYSVWRTFLSVFPGYKLIADLSFHKRFLPVTRFQDFYFAYFTRFQDFCLHVLFLRHDDRFFSAVEYVFLADQIDQSALSHFLEDLRLHTRQIYFGTVSLELLYKIDHSLYT